VLSWGALAPPALAGESRLLSSISRPAPIASL